MKNFALSLVALALLVTVVPARADHHEGEHDEHHGSERVFEMRTYTTPDGKLPELLARFRDHTNYIFVKHGMKLVGYWTPSEGDGVGNTLVYILAHDSREAADKSWEGFRNDPDWKKAAAASRKDGRLVTKVVNQWLKPTDFSPIH